MWLSAFAVLSSCSQRVHYYLGESGTSQIAKMKAQGVLVAKKILQEDCREDSHPEKYIDGSLHPREQFGIYEVNSLNIVPIALFKVSSKGKEYMGSSIVNYLQLQEKDLTGFYTFKDGKLEGLMDWPDVVHHNLSKDCYYFTIHNSNWTIVNSYWKGYQYLKDQSRNLSFLFGVKYFIETLWFMEEEKFYVLDLNEMKIYDPDEFIKTKCYDGFIRDIAEGGQVTCNH